MKNAHEDRLGMFTKVAQFLQDNYRVLIASFPDLANSKNKLDIFIAQIMDATAATNISSSGYTAIKAAARKNLQDNFLRLTRTLSAYAVINNRPDLQANTNLSRSTVEKMRDNDLYIHSKMIADFAVNLVGNLSAFMYTPRDYGDFINSQIAFFSVIQLPKMQISNRVLRNVEVVKLMTQTSSFLNEELDILMGIIEYTNVELFDMYHNHRQIDHSGGRTAASQTITANAAAVSLAPVATVEYESNLKIELENLGTESLTIGLSIDGNAIVGNSIEVVAGAGVNVKMSDLANTGDIIMVKNASNKNVPFKLTIRE
jgi:hypothetical protein